MFVSDAQLHVPSYGYALTLIGSYALTDWAKASLRFDVDQALSITATDLGTMPRQFYFRETRLGLSAAELYTEENTGIKMGPSMSFRIPTDRRSIAQHRILGVVVGGSAKRVFENLGPGDLAVGYNLGLRHNFGPRESSLSVSEASSYVLSCQNAAKDSECLSGYANGENSISNDVNVGYTFLKDWNLSFDFMVVNNFGAQLNDSSLAGTTVGGSGLPVGTSPNAVKALYQSDWVQSKLELGYSITDNLGLALGASTYMPVFIQNKSNGAQVRFPFWDTDTTAYNYSQLYFDVNLTY
jgi:hypothetical protein